MSTVVNLGAIGAGGFVVQGEHAGDEAAFSLSSAGDLNGDGFDDIIIGAPFNDATGTNDGAAYVIYGHAGGFGTVDLAHLSPGQGFKIDGAGSTAFSSTAELGVSVSGAGDVNGDGFDDIIVASDRHGAFGYGDAPAAYVIFGGPTRSATLDLSTGFTGADGFLIRASFENAYSTNGVVSVSGVGDVNGDGFDDVIVGTPFENGAKGAAYVIFGKSGGFGTSGIIDTGALSAADGFAILGGNAGTSVARLGDINGDGFDDIIIGAPYNNSAGAHAGAAYVIFGRAGGFGTIDLANLSSGAGFVIDGDQAGDFAGFSVSGAGDVNGDGHNDIIIGSLDGGSNDQGAAYVIFGKAGGFGTIDLTNLAATDGFVIQGEAQGDIAGRSVAGAGDINHDGFADIIVGAPDNDAGGSSTGRGYVIFGHSGTFSAIDLANLPSAAGFIIQGSAPTGFSNFSVSAAGDVNGDGIDDLLTGTPFDTPGQATVIFGVRTSTPPHVHGDLNGDGRSDVLLRSDSGQLTDLLGKTNGGFLGNDASALVNVPTYWHVAGTGDFNGDGFTDLLWRDDSGNLGEWFGNAKGGFAVNPGLTNVSTDWSVAGTGDFNGDGKTDVLWRNANGQVGYWLANGSGGWTINNGSLVGVSNDWHIAGVGDFNGDGKADILWRNDNGLTGDWLSNGGGGWTMNNASLIGVPADWHVVGTGDFNGDGKSDVLWRSDSGLFGDWLGQVSGVFFDNSANSLISVPTDWQVAATGDYNGDGKDDVLWRNTNGVIGDWLGQANGGFAINAAQSLMVLDSHWHVEQSPGMIV